MQNAIPYKDAVTHRNALQYVTRIEQAENTIADFKAREEDLLIKLKELTDGLFISSKDYDICVAQMRDAWGEMAYDYCSEAQEIIDAANTKEAREQEVDCRTHSGRI